MNNPANRIALMVALAIGALIVAGIVVQRGFDSLQQAYGWERHTQVVRHAIVETVADIQRAEASQRGFVLTGEASWLSGFERSDTRVRASVARLRQLTADNPDQQARLDRLLAAWQLRHLLGQRTIDLARQGKLDAAIAIVRSGQGEEASRTIRATAAEMDRAEEQLLQRRQATARWYETGLKAALLVLLAAVAALLVAGYLADRKDAAHRTRAKERLEQQLARTQAAEAALQRSEARWKFALEGGRHGVFDWDVDIDKVFYSDTYKRLLRFHPGDQLQDNRRAALQRVHPEDRSALVTAMNSLLDGSRREYAVELRMLCSDGQYIWAESRGLVTHSGDGTHIIGTIADVTERRTQSERIDALTVGLERTVRERTAALHQTTARLRSVLNALSEGVIVFRADGMVIDANESAASIVNVALGELIGSNPAAGATVLTEDGTGYRWDDLPFVAAITRGESLRDAIVGLDIPGRGLRWICAQAEPVELETGAADGLAVISFRDITEHRALERQLRESETRWRFAIEGAGDGLWDWCVPDGTVFFSPRWKEMLGYAEHEIGNGLDEWSSRVHPEDLTETLATVGAYLDGSAPSYVSEHRMLCKDGTYKWILDRGMIVSRDDAGRPLRVVGTHADITARKESDRAIRRAADELAATVRELDAANRKLDQHRNRLEEVVRRRTSDLLEAQRIGQIGSWTWDAAEDRLRPSPELCRMFGREPDEFPSLANAKGVTFTEASWMAVNAWATGPIEPGDVFEAELEVLRRDGSVFWARYRAECSPPRSDDNTRFIAGTFQDITEQVRRESEIKALNSALSRLNEHLVLARDAAEQASRAKSAFLAAVSHELRTPLNAVIGFSTLLRDGVPGELNPEQRQQALMINQAGQRLLGLVEDMISVASSRDDAAPVATTSFAVGPLLGRIVADVQEQAKQKGLALHTPPDTGDLAVRADPVRLRQVLANLVANALKFTEKGYVKVSVARSGEYVRLAVEDTGAGIEPDKISQLFQPFARIAPRQGRVFEGTGLGLAVCRQLVESMRGRIGATSEFGSGSTFWVELPCAEAVSGLAACASPGAQPIEPVAPGYETSSSSPVSTS